MVETEKVVAPAEDVVRPKSRKELRLEKKALKKKEKASSASVKQVPFEALSREEKKALLQKQKKEQEKALKKEQRLQIIKEERMEKKIRKQKKLNREKNAKGGANAINKQKKSKMKKDDQETKKDHNASMNIFNNLFNGTKDEITGTTTLRMGIKYKDVKEGEGLSADDRSLVTVSYKLKGYKGTGAIIDSSKNFSFRVGKGEVIKGWDIGVVGMKVGGRRQLIVPPKAGYGSEDIGAGSGALLFFDITLLSMR
jgi:FK506-binding nuclear protein